MRNTNEQVSNAEAKGKRVRRVRNLANLTREAICNDDNINVHTYIGWELGRFGGLTRSGAIAVVNRVAKEGVYCSVDWLLHGIGAAPTVASDFHRAQQDKKILVTDQTKDFLKPSDEDNYIAEELIFFRQHYKETLDLIVEDDAMSPLYVPGDYVAGRKYYKDKISLLVGMNCILQTEDGLLLLRNLRKGSGDYYTLTAINPLTEIPDAILVNVNLVSAAPILWHRRRDLLINQKAL